MIWTTLINHKRPVNLLRQHQPHQLVGQREAAKRNLRVRTLQDSRRQSQRATNDEGDV